jgi:hypothetical protein
MLQQTLKMMHQLEQEICHSLASMAKSTNKNKKVRIEDNQQKKKGFLNFNCMYTHIFTNYYIYKTIINIDLTVPGF